LRKLLVHVWTLLGPHVACLDRLLEEPNLRLTVAAPTGKEPESGERARRQRRFHLLVCENRLERLFGGVQVAAEPKRELGVADPKLAVGGSRNASARLEFFERNAEPLRQ
jgi:hypothetical protein